MTTARKRGRMRVRALHLTVLTVAAFALLSATGSAAASTYDDANVSVYGTDADLNSTAEVEAAIDDGTAEPPEVVLVGARLVVAIDSATLASDLDDRDGTPTERFFAVLDGEPDLLVYQRNYKLRFDPRVFQLGPANTTAYRAGNTTYAVVDTGAVTVDRSSPEGPPEVPGAGQEYDVDVADDVSAASAETREFTIVTERAKFEPEASYDPLAPAAVEIPVSIYVRPDERVVVNLSPDDGRTRSEPVELSERFGYAIRSNATFDLGDVEPGEGYTLELVHDGEVVDERNGTVRDPEASLSDVRFVEVDGQRRLNVTVRLSHGGKVVTETADGDRLTATDEVPPGEPRVMSIPVRESPNAVERLVPERGRLRAVRTGGPTETAYPDSTYAVDGGDVRRGTLTPTPTNPRTPTRNGTTSPPGAAAQPGFGSGLALLAAAVLALVARRRS